MEFVKAKTILSKVNYGNDWYGIDYNMNLYKGCPHKCIYCDSRSNCYHIENFDMVRGKENALKILEQELIKKRNKGVIGIGSMSDTYNPLEKEYEQTRGALKLISKYGFGVSIDTKSDLILRDIDLLKEINSKKEEIPQEILDLAEQRKIARENKDWAKSDELRDLINEKGYEVKDTKNGQEIYGK